MLENAAAVGDGCRKGMDRRSGLAMSREQELRCDAGSAVPVMLSGWDMDVGRCQLLCWLCLEAVRVGDQ